MRLDAHTHLQPEQQSPFASQVFLYSRNPSEWLPVIAKAKEDLRITPGIGIPPWAPASLELLEELLIQHPNLQLGEVGIDHRCIKEMPMPEQIQLLRTQLILAHKLQRSASIHCVQAWGHLCELLETLQREHELPASTIHAWAGSKEILDRLLKLPLLFSMGTRQRENTKIPLPPADRLLWESDDSLS